MEKYKICPYCKSKNPPSVIECINCEADLTGVNITDEETEKMNEANTIRQEPIVEKRMVRICECGTKNPSNARKCSACGEDISDIIPIEDSCEIKKERLFVLSSLDGQYIYEVTSSDVIVGRENSMSDYLFSKSYVSRSQARITKENGEIFIENLSKTNYTFVNNQKITEKTKLNEDDEIGFGGKKVNGMYQEQAAYFKVRIR